MKENIFVLAATLGYADWDVAEFFEGLIKKIMNNKSNSSRWKYVEDHRYFAIVV